MSSFVVAILSVFYCMRGVDLATGPVNGLLDKFLGLTFHPQNPSLLDVAGGSVFRIITDSIYVKNALIPNCLFPADANECDPNADYSVIKKTNDTKIFLFTKQNPWNPEFLHLRGGRLPDNTRFNPDLPTELFVHGWLDGVCTTQWMLEMKNELLKRGDYNVFLVDWSWGNGPDYYKGASNVYKVGNQVAFVLQNIMAQTGATADTFHLIGHSFGAHIVGIAGKQQNPKPRRITALDPALSPFNLKPPSERLTKFDANLVDTIHTNGGRVVGKTIGDSAPYGDADFYPNGGSVQPSCRPYVANSIATLDVFYSIASAVPELCYHVQAIQYYRASINNPQCQLIGHECEDYASFLDGDCGSCGVNGSQCAVLGMDYDQGADKTSDRKYYLTTPLMYPYCSNSFKKSVNFV